MILLVFENRSRNSYKIILTLKRNAYTIHYSNIFLRTRFLRIINMHSRNSVFNRFSSEKNNNDKTTNLTKHLQKSEVYVYSTSSIEFKSH